MSHPVTTENDALRVEVYPQFGGKVLSIVDKADDYELLFDFPSEFPTSCQYDRPYTGGYCAGWDEFFPAIAAGPYPVHPYSGVAIPDHGELWSLPTTTLPAKDGITSEWQGLRFGYHLSRTISLDGPTLSSEYRLHNFTPFDFHFVWSHSAMASVHAPVELQMPAGAYRLSHDENGRRIDAPFEWPVAPGGERLDRPADLPVKRGWKSFANEPIARPALIRYPTRGRSLSIQYTSHDNVAAYWGVWISTGGWGGHRHFAIQPTTGRFDELDRSVRDNSAGCVPPGARVSWTVRWTVAPLS